jgi:RNA polymerase sigma factor (sigma-70 family)
LSNAPTARAAATLEECFARLADGDRSEIPAAFDALWPFVLRTCQKLVRVEADAEDAAQATLIRMFAQASDYQRGRSVRAWAAALAYWECRTANQRRNRDRSEVLETAALLASGEDSPEAIAMRSQLSRALSEALDSLPHDQRKAVEAAVLGEIDATAPAATVRKRRQRAMQYLRSIFVPGADNNRGGEP